MSSQSVSDRAAVEFGPSDNALFADLAGKMGLVGLFFTVTGVLGLILGVLTMMTREIGPGVLGVLVSGAVFTALGVLTRDAGREFRAIARTQGSDLSHLMGVVADLRKLYALLSWVAIAVIGVFLVLLVYTLLQSPQPPMV